MRCLLSFLFSSAKSSGIGVGHIVQKRSIIALIVLMVLVIIWMQVIFLSLAHAASINSQLGDTITSCFSPPPGATQKAIVSATFAADGSFNDKPKITESGEGAINTAFAAAALWAVVRCEARIEEFHLKGTINFSFDPLKMSVESDAGGRPDVPSPARLHAMANAADQLRNIAAKHMQSGGSVSPTEPEIAPLLSILCVPLEAESLHKLSLDQYEAVSQYARYVSAVMEVYGNDSGSRAQAVITQRTRQLGACIDATLWTQVVASSMIENLFSTTPRLLNSPDGRRALERARNSMSTVAEGVLEGYRLEGIGEEWCLGRTRPLDALIRALIPNMQAERKQVLRKALRLAQKCGPVVQARLEPINQVLRR